MTIRIDGTNTAANPGITGTDTDTGLQFGTDEVNIVTGGSTRATVDSSGSLAIGNTSASSFASNGRNIVIGSGSGGNGMTIYSGASDYGNIYFADGVTGTETYRGYVQYHHTNDALIFGTGAAERARIDGSGNLRFNSGYGSVATAYGVRAWVQWDASPSNSIKGSGNVSSITDNGTGRFTINFTNNMPDAGYAVANGVSGLNDAAPSVDSLSTSSFNFDTWAGAYVDNNVNGLIVTR